MGNDLTADCCSSNAANVPEFNFLDVQIEDVPEIRMELPNTLAHKVGACCPATQFGSKQDDTIDLTDNGIENIETNIKEHI